MPQPTEQPICARKTCSLDWSQERRSLGFSRSGLPCYACCCMDLGVAAALIQSGCSPPLLPLRYFGCSRGLAYSLCSFFVPRLAARLQGLHGLSGEVGALAGGYTVRTRAGGVGGRRAGRRTIWQALHRIVNACPA